MITPEEQQKQREILDTAHHDFEKGLNRHAFFKVSNHATGEDLVQETFMKTWVYLAKGGKVHIMKAFLYHILNNLIIDEYRKHKTTSLDALIEKGFDPKESESDKLLGIMDGKSALLLIARLPEKYQKVLRMRYVQDLSLEEMSIITGQSKKTLSVQVFRGVEKLRALYKEI
jgi:RNA polymerase sigma-70 factor (ECF subfamily)